uniref:Uncharacterized protein n=1 Tax=Romanomermis culicivorax TaxID=13658 RepID=A0A915JIZ0_ROMCU
MSNKLSLIKNITIVIRKQTDPKERHKERSPLTAKPRKYNANGNNKIFPALSDVVFQEIVFQFKGNYGERTIFCRSECGVLRFAEKLEYAPICLLGYAA